MALDSILKKGVKIAHKATKSVQSDVTHFHWVSSDGFGVKTFSPTGGTVIKMVVNRATREVKIDGRMVTISATLTVIDRISVRFDVRDEILLPDGYRGTIVFAGGVESPSLGLPYAVRILLAD